MLLPDGEPRSGPRRVRTIDGVVRGVRAPSRARPVLLAVDGRSGSGKTTVARQIVGRVSGAAVVHTDNVAWRPRNGRSSRSSVRGNPRT